MTWKLINDLDEDSLRKLLDELPAWVKVCVCANVRRYLSPADRSFIRYTIPLERSLCNLFLHRLLLRHAAPNHCRLQTCPAVL